MPKGKGKPPGKEKRQPRTPEKVRQTQLGLEDRKVPRRKEVEPDRSSFSHQHIVT